MPSKVILDMPRKDFQNAFQTASRAVSYKKGGGPGNHVLIRTNAQEGTAWFYGTNVETTIRHRVGCETAESHVVMFDQQLLSDLLAASDGENVRLSWNGRYNYTYLCGNTEAEFRTVDPDQFPMPRIDHEVIVSFSGERFRTVARQLDVVNAGEQGGFRMYKAEDGQLWFEAYDLTGGFVRVKLGSYTVFAEEANIDYIMLNKSVRVAADVFGDKSESVRLLASKNEHVGTVILDGQDTTVIVRLFAANWPPMHLAFEGAIPAWIEADRKDWIQGLTLMQLLSDTDLRGGKFEVIRFFLDMRPGGATVRTYNKGGRHESKRELTVTATMAADELSYLLSSSYILSAMNTLKAKRVRVGFAHHAVKPIITGCAVWSEEDPQVEWRFPGFTTPVVEDKKTKEGGLTNTRAVW
jgi:hypothetical protein